MFRRKTRASDLQLALEQARKDREYAAYCRRQWEDYSKKYHALLQTRRADIAAIKAEIVRREWRWGAEDTGHPVGKDHGQPTYHQQLWLKAPNIDRQYEFVAAGGADEALAALYARVKFAHDVNERLEQSR